MLCHISLGNKFVTIFYQNIAFYLPLIQRIRLLRMSHHVPIQIIMDTKSWRVGFWVWVQFFTVGDNSSCWLCRMAGQYRNTSRGPACLHPVLTYQCGALSVSFLCALWWSAGLLFGFSSYMLVSGLSVALWLPLLAAPCPPSQYF